MFDKLTLIRGAGSRVSANLILEELDGIPLSRGIHCLGHGTASDLGRVISKVLVDAGRLLVDLQDAWIEHESSSLVFAAALDRAGGWPQRRLILFGGDPELVRTLDRLRVTKTVPHAESVSEAVNRLGTRPARVRRRITLEPRPDSVLRAQTALAAACSDWELPAQSVELAHLVLKELVANAVEHARSLCHVVVELDGTRLWLAVSDYSPHELLRPRRADPWSAHGKGLQYVAILSDQWGVEYLRQAKTVWAELTLDTGLDVTGGSRPGADSRVRPGQPPTPLVRPAGAA